MFVGHAMLAFALAAGSARWAGCSSERSLSLGLVVGAFATLPDVDMLYALSGVFDDTLGIVDGFWSASTLVHRVVTHSLVVGAVSAVGFALWSYGSSSADGERPRKRRVDGRALSGLVVLVAVIVTAGIGSGWLTLGILTAFVLAGLAVTTIAVRLSGLGPRAILATALLGLLSHPFGDLFTGEPPGFLYPFDAQLVTERVALSADPTLHLLGTFGLELATVWMAAIVYCWMTDRSIRGHVHWRAALGVGYAGAALAVPAPTVDSSYRFVFSVLAVGVVGAAPLVRQVYRTPRWVYDRSRRRLDGAQRMRTVVDKTLPSALTGLAAITLAGLSFAVVYLITL